MTKIIIICGPTAVGKTKFALSQAEKYGADLISVDSRQVYRGMDIGTGKDIPNTTPFTKHSTFSVGLDTYTVGYYTIKNVNLWLYDVATPNQPFSSAIYKQAFDIAIQAITNQKKPIILIGGTGYYLKSSLYPPTTMAVPPNQMLRDKLEKYTLIQLQQRLQKINAARFIQMNQSDKANPRRLIRAIEVSESKPTHKVDICSFETKWFGLTSPRDYLANRITSRVQQRIKKDFSHEMMTLEKRYPGYLNLPAGNTLGYQEWGKYLTKEWSRETAITHWIQAEIAYAKRQLTWFNKQSNLEWFDISKQNWYAQASDQLERWIKYGTSHT